jgi:hypothetical protein
MKGFDSRKRGLTWSLSFHNCGGETSLRSTLKIDPVYINLLPWFVLFHPENTQEDIGVECFSINFPIENTVEVTGSGPEVNTAPWSARHYTIVAEFAKVWIFNARSLG